MIDLTALQPLQLDALREVANIGAGHAATALSELTRRPVMVNVPRVALLRADEARQNLGPLGTVFAAVRLAIAGDLTSRALLLFDREAALRLCRLVVAGPPGTDGALTELEASALREVSNILTSAYTNALSTFLGLVLLPSVPELCVDRLEPIVESPLFGFGRRGQALCVETRFRFRDDSRPIAATFFLFPGAGALSTIFKAIRLHP